MSQKLFHFLEYALSVTEPHMKSWRNLGRVLGVNSDHLAVIGHQYSSQPYKALTQVVLHWILDENTAEVSYSKLADAMRYIGHPAAADTVARARVQSESKSFSFGYSHLDMVLLSGEPVKRGRVFNEKVRI